MAVGLLSILLLCAAALVPMTSTAFAQNCAWSLVSTADPGPVASLEAVSGDDDEAWAVGWYATGGEPDLPTFEAGDPIPLMKHFDGQTWTNVPVAAKGAWTLNDVVFISPDDVWVVGARAPKPNRPGSTEKTLAMHYNGSEWSTVSTPNAKRFGSSLSAVDATGPARVWAVGHSLTKDGDERALVMRFDGAGWNLVPRPARGSDAQLSGIEAISDEDVWVVGSTSAGVGALVQRWDGRTWSNVSTPDPRTAEDDPRSSTQLNDIDAAPDGTLFAVGIVDEFRGSAAYTLRGGDAGWTLTPGGDHRSSAELVSIDAGERVLAAGFLGEHDRVFTSQIDTLVETYSSASGGWSISSTPNPGEESYMWDVSVFDGGAWGVGHYANPVPRPDGGPDQAGPPHTMIQRLTC